MRHLAWLGAVPQPKKQKRLNDTTDEPTQTRLQVMQAKGIEPELAPCSAPHLVNLLMEIGPIEPAGADTGPISWVTIRAFQEVTAIPLSPWEAHLMKRLSSDFLAESRAARDEDRPSPFGSVTQEQRDAVANKVRSLFGGLFQRMRPGGRGRGGTP